MTAPEHADAPSILIVDDTIENLRLLAGMLATRGFDARPVTSGREALQVIAHAAPDLVLLDVTMPDMNGFEVCAKIRENPAWQDIPVIFLTALTDISDKVKGFTAGGTDYITKPFHLEEVLARVSNQLALRKARQDLEETVARLQETERLRDDLVHMIVHDMRSPLTALLMELELMKMDATSEQAESIKGAMRGATGLNELATAMLDVSRLEEGKMPLTMAPTDIVQLAEEARARLAAMDPGRTIEVTSTGTAVAHCDRGLARRVIENLLSNGIKHTPEGGNIRIAVTTHNGRVRVAVQDEGPGVPVEARQRIFEKFGAVAARKDSKYHSVGLGLAFCKLAVEAHRGTIGVEPASPRGSVFSFELPM